ncbi:MAG: hypothetical protein LBB84_07280 [Tannerellaceae bacterium]|jgi:hypothetical protein|nr:hypothetical protein [Tannerellaceae bacterium]
MKHVFITLCLFLLFCSAGCSNNEFSAKEETGEELELRSGTFHYVEVYQKWVISYHIPGTIDSVNTYLISNPEKDYPKGHLKVEFSGVVSLSDIPPSMGGETIYNIKLTKLIFK